MTKQECRMALEKGERITSLAALIEVALDDAQGLDRKRYVPHNGLWHRTVHGMEPMPPEDIDERCHVCLGGMVIAGTLRVEHGKKVAPGDPVFDDGPRHALYALDEVRTGRWADAANRLGLTAYPSRIWMDVPEEMRDRLPDLDNLTSPADMRNLKWFVTWERFDVFATVLREKAVPVLREIEEFLQREVAPC